MNFNPLSPCGERPVAALTARNEALQFQSTLPMRGETAYIIDDNTGVNGFQSTLPMRGETTATLKPTRQCSNFNPLSPCGERPEVAKRAVKAGVFQSTLPMRGETEFAVP